MNSPSTRARSPLASRRRGFTLVELLVVIVIIGILIALLLPAINGAVRTAKVAATSAEANQLAQALAQFKTQYGVYPPSKIVLSETGNYTPAYLRANAGSTQLGTEAVLYGPRSVQYLRRIWPKMTITTSGTTLNQLQIPGGWYDFNGDNVAPTTDGNGNLTAGQVHILDGAECLVFFLGGLPGMVDGSMVTTGFSKNPSNPAINSLITPLGSNRSSPTFEFRPGRLADNYPMFSGTTLPGNGFPEYSDNLTASGTQQPFVYFSSYEGAGYDPDDVNYAEEGTHVDGTTVAGTWTAWGRPNSGVGSIFFNNVGSFAPNPYTNGSPIAQTGNTTNPEYINKNTFQIISAGIDGQFGPGGGYKANANDPLAPLTAALMPVNLSPQMRLRENDNVTNFKGGRLD